MVRTDLQKHSDIILPTVTGCCWYWDTSLKYACFFCWAVVYPPSAFKIHQPLDFQLIDIQHIEALTPATITPLGKITSW